MLKFCKDELDYIASFAMYKKVSGSENNMDCVTSYKQQLIFCNWNKTNTIQELCSFNSCTIVCEQNGKNVGKEKPCRGG